MAPEQANRKPIDARADLFSLGCVLYLMTTGRLPFEGEDALATLMAVACADPVAPRGINPLVPSGVEKLILAMLEKKPRDRPGSAREVIEAIRGLSHESR
jgi:serine/threonine protein kinase